MIGLRAAKDFIEPRSEPEWKPFERGRWALSYDPYYRPPETTETETTPKKESAKKKSAKATASPGNDSATTTKP
jgi:hypothetical protein